MDKVLLVDDDPRMTRVIATLLTRHGFEVSTTNRAFGVLNVLADERPDTVVLDINMPGLKGDELVDLIREDASLSGVRVILYSGVPAHELRARAERVRADGYVHKTDDLDHLVRALRAA